MLPSAEKSLPSPVSTRSSVRPLHVTIVDEELPYPPTSGKRIRTFNLIRRLAPRHRLTLLCHRNADVAEGLRAEAYFAGIGVQTVVVDRKVPAKSGPLFYARLAANLLSPLPYSVAIHDSRELRLALERHAKAHRVDLWHCEWTPYAEALQAVQGPRLVHAHNVESVIWQRYFEVERNSLKRWYIGRQWAKYQRFERRAAAAADRVVAVSDVDAARLRDDFGIRRVDVVENGVDERFFQAHDGPCDPHRLLFLGSLDWRPNLDGARILLAEVFPVVRATMPSATLSLVGRQPPAWLREAAARSPGVELHADVPDVLPHLGRSGALVVPLRIGGGSRLKILEALAAGLPVVSTAVGAEGLRLRPNHHFVQVGSVADLARALIEALRDPTPARRQAAAGRRFVIAHHNWDRLADNLEQVWIACTADRRPLGTPRKGAASCTSLT